MKIKTKSGTYLLTSYRWIGKQYWEWRRVGGPKSLHTWSKREECKKDALRHASTVERLVEIGGS